MPEFIVWQLAPRRPNGRLRWPIVIVGVDTRWHVLDSFLGQRLSTDFDVCDGCREACDRLRRHERWSCKATRQGAGITGRQEVTRGHKKVKGAVHTYENGWDGCDARQLIRVRQRGERRAVL